MVETRRAQRETDFQRVVELAHPMWLTHADEEPEFLRRSYLENYDIKAYFQKCFDNPDKNALFVAEEDGKVVGIVRAEMVEIDGMFVEQKAIYVDDLVVDEKYRKRGIARRLLELTEEFAKENGIKILKSRVYEFNKPAQQFLRDCGFHNLYSECFKVVE